MSSSKKLLQAAAGNAGESLYVEDVFSTYLYTGNGSTQTITNGIDLAGEGGLVWSKGRNYGTSHYLGDTERGTTKYLLTDGTYAAFTSSNAISSFNSDGYSFGSQAQMNGNGYNFVSWTFRKAEKFFDIVTWTGDGSTTTHSHNLGSTPAVIIVKRLDSSSPWSMYHKDASDGVRSAEDLMLYLNTNAAPTYLGSTLWAATDSTFTTTGGGNFNASGGTYVAYLFASDAGGYGDDGSENIIKCGGFTGDGYNNTVIDCGFEAQWLLIRRNVEVSSWVLLDMMRGFPYPNSSSPYGDMILQPGAADQEGEAGGSYGSASNGFIVNGPANKEYIYIAIRRPMKTPESGTEVFDPNYTTSNQFVTTGFPVDLQIGQYTGGGDAYWVDRLRVMSTSTTGSMRYLRSTSSNAEASNTGSLGFNGFVQNGFNHTLGNFAQRLWSFKRATGFFDAVAYTGTSSARTIPHNLGVVPEFIIVKNRESNANWICYHSGNTAAPETEVIKLNETDGTSDYDAAWNDTAPTSSVFTVGSYSATNNTGQDLIAYLFATLAGVSKVGSYTGTGSNVNVDCGFSAGARFILIKRSDSIGDWYVYDSARGIVAGNDPYLRLNSTAAEVTNTDYIDPLSSGFTVTSSAPAALNASGGNYIFLAIA